MVLPGKLLSNPQAYPADLKLCISITIVLDAAASREDLELFEEHRWANVMGNLCGNEAPAILSRRGISRRALALAAVGRVGVDVPAMWLQQHAWQLWRAPSRFWGDDFTKVI
jgi:hypothetical protein